MLDRLLQQARDGQGAVLLLRGEPGIGKTALLDYAASGADGMRLLRGSGFESETGIPFAFSLFREVRNVTGRRSAGWLPQARGRTSWRADA